MQSVLQTLGLNQYSCTSFSVPAFSIECLKNPSFHGDPAPGQPGFLAKKKKKRKQQVGSGHKGWPSSGSRRRMVAINLCPFSPRMQAWKQSCGR